MKRKCKFPKAPKVRKPRRNKPFEFFRESDILDKRRMWTGSGRGRKRLAK